VTIEGSICLDYGIHLTSVGAVQLASLLSKFNKVTGLNLDLKECSAAAVEALVTSITHKTLNKLILTGVSLTPAATRALGQSLPEISSLQELGLTSFDGGILQAEEMETLFGGFNKAMSLHKLTLSGFSVTNCLSPLIKCLPFFPNLRELKLERLNIDEQDYCGLLKSFGFLNQLVVFINGKPSVNSFCYFGSRDDKMLNLRVSLTPAVAAMLGRILPELSSLKSLEFESYRSILETPSIEALFGGFNKTMPLHSLMITVLNARGSFTPLFRSFRFFPTLVKLTLKMLNMDEHDLRGLLESFQFIPNLQELNLSDNPLGHAVTSIVPHVIHLKKLRYLCIANTSHSAEDLNYVRDTVRQALPEVKISTGFSSECNQMYSIKLPFSSRFSTLTA